MGLSTRHLENFLAFFFPDYCYGCNIRGALLCKQCISASRIGASDTEATAPLLYRGKAKQALWALKYAGMKRLAIPFGEILYEHLLPIASEFNELHPGRNRPYLIIPIPLHPNRERERGYNQTSLIAHAIAQQNPELFAVAENILTKRKPTKPQATCTTKKERLVNIRNSFELHQEAPIVGEPVILLDDVRTTGATLEEAERVLKTARPEAVILATLMQTE